MKLSIAIINYNTKGFLEMCLRSINNSVKPWEYEIIIIDNASNDDLITVISKESSTIKFSVNKQNVGFAKAYNQAIKEAKGEYILLLNPDVVLLPTTMTRCVEFLERHPEASVVTCYVELVDSKIDPACHRGFPDPWTSFTYFIGLEKLFPKSRLFGRYHLGWLPLNTIHEIDTPSGCFYMIRKSVIDEVGLLDENYFLYYEEVDWSYRIKQKGWKIFFLPEVKIIHYKGIASGIKKTTQHLSKASKETKKLAINSFCNSMKIFYDKYYKSKYPFVVTWLMYLGIEIKRCFNLRRLRFNR